MKALTTTELNHKLASNAVTRRYFVGTYPACITPITDKTIYSFITNVDEHDEVGQHWNGWFVRDSKLFFFDSFGREYDDETLPLHYLNIVEQYDSVECSTKRVQGWESVACGHFSTHFIYVMSLGLSYDSFLKDYSFNYEKNDEIVSEFYHSID